MVRREYYAQRRQLNAIENAAIGLRDQQTTPRTLAAVTCGVLAFGGAWLFRGMSTSLLDLLIAVVALLVAFSMCYRFSTFAKCWSDVVDRRLAKYNPVSHAAYLELQKATVIKGGLDVNALFHWLEIESAAVADLAPNPLAGTGKRFTEKTLAKPDDK